MWLHVHARKWVGEFSLINNWIHHGIKRWLKSSCATLSPSSLRFACLLGYPLPLPPPPPPCSFFSSSSLPLSPRPLSSIFSNTQSFRPSCSARSTPMFEKDTRRLMLLVASTATRLKRRGAQHWKPNKCGIQTRRSIVFDRQKTPETFLILWKQLVTSSEHQQPCLKWKKTSRLNETVEQMAPCDLDLNS